MNLRPSGYEFEWRLCTGSCPTGPIEHGGRQATSLPTALPACPICTLRRPGVSGGIREPFVWHRRRHRSTHPGRFGDRCRGSFSCRPCQPDAAPPRRTAALFSRVVGELGFHYIAVERALLVEQGRRSRAKAVGAVSLARPADRESASGDQRYQRRSRVPSATESILEVVQHEVSVALGIVGHNGWGTHDKTPPATSRYHVRSIPP